MADSNCCINLVIEKIKMTSKFRNSIKEHFLSTDINCEGIPEKYKGTPIEIDNTIDDIEIVYKTFGGK